MEVQNQIYLVVAVGGGAITLLLVLTILLAVYVRKTRTLLEDYIGFSADAPYSGEADRRNNRQRNDNSQHGYPMDVFSHGMGPRGDQTKARNDHMHNARNINSNRHGGPYRNDVEAMGGYLGGGKRGVAGGGGGVGGGGEKPMKANHSHHKAPRSQASVDDSALELEVANIFDMDELDEEDLSDFNSGPSGHGDPKDGRYLGNGPPDGGGPPGGRPKRPGGPVAAPHQYDRELGGRPGNGGNEGRGNRFQNPHAAMKSKGAGGGGGGNGMRGDGLKEGKQNQGYYDDRGDMY